ncbi:MAG: BamA/TamA family outer membrane protein [Fibrobacteria bacterium]|nr:BamA/TamA family outer membrane protein [Fibrobacteria bacterium]
MSRFRHIATVVLLALAARAAAQVRLEIPDAGILGRGRISDLVDVSADLVAMDPSGRTRWIVSGQSAILGAARQQGFLEADCRMEIVSLDSVENLAKVLVVLDQGARFHFRHPRVVLDDSGEAPSPEPRSLPVDHGEVYLQEKVSEQLQWVVEWYKHRGWLDATATPSVHADTLADSVDFVVHVEPGRAAVFGQFLGRVEGRTATDTGFLRDLWGVRPGDTLRSEMLSRFTRKIYRTRLFSTVRLERKPLPEDPSRTQVDLILKERAPGAVEGALSWEPTFGWALEASMRHRNVLGRFHELSATGAVAQFQQKVRAGYATPLLFGSPISLDYGIQVKQQDAGLVDDEVDRELSLSNDGTFSYPPTDWASISLSLSAERLSKRFLTGAENQQYQYAVVAGGLLDFRDEPFDPISGWSLRGVVGNGGQFGFDSTYSWVQGQGKLWVPLFWRFLSAGVVEGGRFLNSTTVDGAGIFWQGGSRSVRSYRFNQAKVVVGAGEALRPRYLRASSELRVNLPWNVQVVGFEDWARLWNEGEEPDLEDLSKAWIGYGMGLRYRVSLLSLRLDYALGRGDERWAFDLAQAI